MVDVCHDCDIPEIHAEILPVPAANHENERRRSLDEHVLIARLKATKPLHTQLTGCGRSVRSVRPEWLEVDDHAG